MSEKKQTPLSPEEALARVKTAYRLGGVDAAYAYLDHYGVGCLVRCEACGRAGQRQSPRHPPGLYFQADPTSAEPRVVCYHCFGRSQ